jgi:hypothetical protein
MRSLQDDDLIGKLGTDDSQLAQLFHKALKAR